MSTFGKKALIWWNYDDHSKQNIIRFNHTNDELQLDILKKWYPIGSRCREVNRYSSITTNLNRIVNDKRPNIYNWEIIDYTKTIGGYYVLKVRHIDTSNNFNRETNIIPLRSEISPDDLKRIKREAKLSKLGF